MKKTTLTIENSVTIILEEIQELKADIAAIRESVQFIYSKYTTPIEKKKKTRESKEEAKQRIRLALEAKRRAKRLPR